MGVDEHVAVVRDIFERAGNRADFDGLEAVFGAEIKFHFRGSTRITDLEDLKRLVAAWRSAFPDHEFTIEDLVANEGWWRCGSLTPGRISGPGRGWQPPGRRFEVDAMVFFRFEDGRFVELWEVEDEYAIWAQLGKPL